MTVAFGVSPKDKVIYVSKSSHLFGAFLVKLAPLADSILKRWLWRPQGWLFRGPLLEGVLHEREPHVLKRLPGPDELGDLLFQPGCLGSFEKPAEQSTCFFGSVRPIVSVSVGEAALAHA